METGKRYALGATNNNNYRQSDKKSDGCSEPCYLGSR